MKKQLIVPVLCVFLILITAAALDAQPKLRVATVTFTANVSGAKVYLNDKYLGDTPYANKFQVGNYTLRLSADGYEDYVKPIQITNDTTFNVNLKPAPRDFNVNIRADARGAKVFIDDRAVGNAPFRGRLRQGQHSVRIVAEGYDEYNKTIDVNGDIDIRADLQRRVRDFNVSIQAEVRGAKIFIDDRAVGNSPFRGRIQEGQHEVRVTADGYDEYVKTIDVNGDVSFRVDMHRSLRTFTLSIQANADQAKVSINGQEQNGFAPMDLKLDQGRYTVVVSRRGYTPYTATIDLNRDQRIDAQLGAPKAQVVIDLPNQRGIMVIVSIDGKRMQGTQFDVANGRHTVRVEAAGMVAEQQIDCRPGRVYRLKLVLDLQTPQESDRDFGPGGRDDRGR